MRRRRFAEQLIAEFFAEADASGANDSLRPTTKRLVEVVRRPGEVYVFCIAHARVHLRTAPRSLIRGLRILCESRFNR